MTEQVQRVLHPAGAEQRGGIQDRAQLPGAEAPRCLRQSDRAIQQGLVQVVGAQCSPPPIKAQPPALVDPL